MKRVASISLGSPKGDKTVNAVLLGEESEISRVGTGGNMARFAQLVREADGKVDAICFGGIDMYLYAGNRRYTIQDAAKLAANAKLTPVVDGSGIKNTLERKTIEWLQEKEFVDFKRSKTLIVSAVDRFGMAESIHSFGGKVIYGDVMFALGIPLPVRSWGGIQLLARTLLPIICVVPFKWLYPTGEKQDEITPKYEGYYRWADVIAGDFKYIKRHMPAPETGALAGKFIVTNTLTPADIEDLKARGVDTVATATLEFDGRVFGTNVLEGITIALSGKRPEQLSASDYVAILEKLDWQPTVKKLG